MSSHINTKFAFLSESKGLGDLKSKSYAELTELLERQNHILLNKSLISKLKDKGERIRKTKDEILQELECRKTQSIISKKPIGNNSSMEWKDSTTTSEASDNNYKEEKPDALRLLSENGQIPNHSTQSHISMLIDKEREPDFSFKPYTSVVAEKIKKIVPDAHTVNVCPTLAKTIHLDESLNLLSQQMSALKVLGTRSKRLEQCIEDRQNESAQDIEEENEESDEQETKVGSGVSVNVNISD